MGETYHAQTDEDRLLEMCFNRKREGCYVEVGAYDGVDMSNTYHFEQLGWKGILIEADGDLAARCRANRPNAIVENCAAVSPNSPKIIDFEIVEENRGLSSIGLNSIDRERIQHWTGSQKIRRVQVQAKTVDEILEHHAFSHIDFVTIDVEGHEFEVLQGFTLSRWRPTIVIVERNRRLPDPRIMRRLHSSGYTWDRTTGVNDWFVRGTGLKPGLVYHIGMGIRYYLPKYAAGSLSRLRKGLGRVHAACPPVLRR